MPVGPSRDLSTLLHEAPYVRALARALCSDGTADADEVTQQAWLRAIQHGGDGVDEPRTWLARIVRNVAHNLRRADRTRRDRERAAARTEAVPSSAELMEREERRRQLVRCVDALPASQRAVLLLRYFEGLPPRRIAARLDLPIGAVWNLHRRGLSRLRAVLDDRAREHGRDSRRAWLWPLLGPVPMRAPAPLGLPLLGTITMTTKTKLAALAGVMAALVAYATWSGVGAAGSGSETERAVAPALTSDALSTRVPMGPGADDDVERRVAQSPRDATKSATGTLVVRVAYASAAGDPAAGVGVHLRRRGQDHRAARRGRTDADGMATFAGLAPGKVVVDDDRFGAGKSVEIVAGATATAELVLGGGFDLRGRVIDEGGVGIGGATIDVAMAGLVGVDPESLATTDATGRFEIRSTPVPAVVAARAPGFLASPIRLVHPDTTKDPIDIVLVRGGGSVEGRVFGPDGTPVANAVVCVGAGDVQGLFPQATRPRTMPALTRTDHEGWFRAVGLAPGEQPVWVAARPLAAWRGTCAVVAHGVTNLRVDMLAGASIRGFVTTADGTPVARAEVLVGAWGAPENLRTGSQEDGAYVVDGLPPGDVQLKVEHDDAGQRELSVTLSTGEQRELSIQLTRGLELRGRVLDQSGAPVAGVFLRAWSPRSAAAESWSGDARSADDGTFTVPNCPSGSMLTVEAEARDIVTHRIADVDPRAGEVEVRVRRTEPSVFIVGQVLTPDGTPVAAARVAPGGETRFYTPTVKTDAEGRFQIGPLVPGTWQLSIREPGHASTLVPPRRLTAGERWDLGKIYFDAGGTVVLVAEVADADRLHFVLQNAAGRRWSLPSRGRETVSEVIPVGEYRVLAWGPQTAAAVVPFAVIRDQRTPVELPLVAGVPQHFDFESTGDTLLYGASIEIHRGTQKLVDWWLPCERGQPWGCDIALAPGSYRVVAVGAQRGEAQFTVGDTPGPAVRVALR